MTHWRTPHGQFRKPTPQERVSAHVERINARAGRANFQGELQQAEAQNQAWHPEYFWTPAEIMEMQRQASSRPVWWRRWLGLIQR